MFNHNHRLAKWFYKNNHHYLGLSEGDQHLTEEIFYVIIFVMLISLLSGMLLGGLLWNWI